MIYKNKKILAHFETEKLILALLISAILVIPILTVCIGVLLFDADFVRSVYFCLKWSAYILPIIIILLAGIAFYYSDFIIYKESSLYYYRFIFSKAPREIPYSEITECIISDGLWKNKGEYTRGRKIYLFNKNTIIGKYDIYSKIMFMCIAICGEHKVKIIDGDNKPKSLNSFYKLDYDSLTVEQKLKVCKHYCKLMKHNLSHKS